MTLRKNLNEVMTGTTSREFVRWCKWMDEVQWYETEPLHYYLAQLTAEVRRSWVAKPERVQGNQFLIDFAKAMKKQTRQKRRSTPEESEAFWFAALGLTKPKKPKG